MCAKSVLMGGGGGNTPRPWTQPPGNVLGGWIRSGNPCDAFEIPVEIRNPTEHSGL